MSGEIRERCAACPVECGVCDTAGHCPEHCAFPWKDVTPEEARRLLARAEAHRATLTACYAQLPQKLDVLDGTKPTHSNRGVLVDFAKDIVAYAASLHAGLAGSEVEEAILKLGLALGVRASREP